MRSPTFEDTGSASPALGPCAAEPPVAAQRAAIEAPVARAAGVASTALLLEVPAEARGLTKGLPFKPPVPGHVCKKTLQAAMMRRSLEQTAPVGDDAIAKAMAVLPFRRSRVGAGPAPCARLTLSEYASLRAELAVWPWSSAEILARYYVPNEAARRALEGHWDERLATRPGERAELERALAEYTAWLRTQRMWYRGG